MYDSNFFKLLDTDNFLEIVQSSNNIQLIPLIFGLIQRLEKFIFTLNQKYNLIEDQNQLEKIIETAQIVFSKGYRRLQIRNDKTNKLAQWSIKYSLEKLGYDIKKSLANEFQYWNNRRYGKFFELVKVEEIASIAQKEIINYFQLYIMYKNIIWDLKLAENFQVYKKIEEIFSQLINKRLHKGKNFLKIYFYCIYVIIIDEILEENEDKLTPEKCCIFLNVESRRYQNLIKTIFKFKDSINRKKKKMLDTPNERKSIESMKTELRVANDILSLDKSLQLRIISWKLYSQRKNLKEITIEFIIYLFYRYFHNNLVNPKDQIIKIIYTSLLIFNKEKKNLVLNWFEEELINQTNFSNLDLRETNEFSKFLDEFLIINQILKEDKHKNIKIRNSILDYKIGLGNSKLSDYKNLIIECERSRKNYLTQENVENFFKNFNILIKKNYPLNPKIIKNLCDSINLIDKSEIKKQINPRILYNLLIFIIKEFYKPNRKRQIKIKQLKNLLKAIIAYDYPIILYFIKSIITRKTVDMKFTLFFEQYLKNSNFNLFSRAFFAKKSYSKIYKQMILDNF